MPYVSTHDRERFAPTLEEAEREMEERGVTPGVLNYLVSKLAAAYVRRKGRDYTHLNDVVGALDSAKAEFVRRVVAPYEDEKIAANGDIYS